MSKISEFAGKFEIKVDGNTYELEPVQEEKWALMDLCEKGKSLTSKDMAEFDKVLAALLKRSDPKATDKQINGFLLKYSEDMISELTILFGFAKREDMEKLKEVALKKNQEKMEEALK